MVHWQSRLCRRRTGCWQPADPAPTSKPPNKQQAPQEDERGDPNGGPYPPLRSRGHMRGLRQWGPYPPLRSAGPNAGLRSAGPTPPLDPPILSNPQCCLDPIGQDEGPLRWSQPRHRCRRRGGRCRCQRSRCTWLRRWKRSHLKSEKGENWGIKGSSTDATPTFASLETKSGTWTSILGLGLAFWGTRILGCGLGICDEQALWGLAQAVESFGSALGLGLVI